MITPTHTEPYGSFMFFLVSFFGNKKSFMQFYLLRLFSLSVSVFVDVVFLNVANILFITFQPTPPYIHQLHGVIKMSRLWVALEDIKKAEGGEFKDHEIDRKKERYILESCHFFPCCLFTLFKWRKFAATASLFNRIYGLAHFSFRTFWRTRIYVRGTSVVNKNGQSQLSYSELEHNKNKNGLSRQSEFFLKVSVSTSTMLSYSVCHDVVIKTRGDLLCNLSSCWVLCT